MFFYFLQIIGTIFFAISGAISGYKKDFDLTGVMLIAFAVGNGGGTMRDVLIGATPVFWIQQPIYIFLTMLTGLVVFFIAENFNLSSKAFLIADAFGLGIFVITGSQKALNLGLSPVIAVMMGVLSAVGGGLIRDILSREVPIIFQPEIYATAALAGGTVYVLLHSYFPDTKFVAGIACAATIILIRLGTLLWNWKLPTPTWLKTRI